MQCGFHLEKTFKLLIQGFKRQWSELFENVAIKRFVGVILLKVAPPIYSVLNNTTLRI